MAEVDRLDPHKLWVWFDTETSDLSVTSLTVLEFAYTITDRDLAQLTEIRSRLCGFAPVGSKTGVITPKHTCWDRDVNSDVQRLHKDSGLIADYRSALDHTIVPTMTVMDQFILDDLSLCGWDGKTKFVLAGSGIAAFDRPLLGCLGSRVLPQAHYRSADVSCALEVLGVSVPKTLEDFDATITNLTGGYRSEILEQIDFEDSSTPTHPHRAAGDVARSLTLARALRWQQAKWGTVDVP